MRRNIVAYANGHNPFVQLDFSVFQNGNISLLVGNKILARRNQFAVRVAFIAVTRSDHARIVNADFRLVSVLVFERTRDCDYAIAVQIDVVIAVVRAVIAGDVDSSRNVSITPNEHAAAIIRRISANRAAFHCKTVINVYSAAVFRRICGNRAARHYEFVKNEHAATTCRRIIIGNRAAFHCEASAFNEHATAASNRIVSANCAAFHCKASAGNEHAATTCRRIIIGNRAAFHCEASAFNVHATAASNRIVSANCATFHCKASAFNVHATALDRLASCYRAAFHKKFAAIDVNAADYAAF